MAPPEVPGSVPAEVEGAPEARARLPGAFESGRGRLLVAGLPVAVA
ncbi:MAG TPA: hypothetical protein VNM90_30750 [Haliangium sp.]|nr:hypothetical protein [Haliangium sp.]